MAAGLCLGNQNRGIITVWTLSIPIIQVAAAILAHRGISRTRRTPMGLSVPTVTPTCVPVAGKRATSALTRMIPMHRARESSRRFSMSRSRPADAPEIPAIARFGKSETGHNDSRTQRERDTMIGPAPVTAWGIRNLPTEQKRLAIWIAARMGQEVRMGYDNDTFGHAAFIGK